MDILFIKHIEYFLLDNFKKACPEMFIYCHKDIQPNTQMSKGKVNVIAF